MMNRAILVAAICVAAALSGCSKSEDAGTAASSESTAPTTSTAPATDTTSSASTAATTPPTMPAAPASTTAASSAPAAADAATTTVAAGGADGKAVFDKTCALCHTAGVAGAPKPGDKADWGPRIAQGNDTLYKHAIEGFTGHKGMMPAKGGNTALSDAEVKAAVDFMVTQSS